MKIDKGTYTRFALDQWNDKLYPGRNDNSVPGSFWEEFDIESAPRNNRACWSHIPKKWETDVRLMLGTARSELGKRIEFAQVKEKFCSLVVYFTSKDDDAHTRMRELVEECKGRLKGKGLHPNKFL